MQSNCNPIVGKFLHNNIQFILYIVSLLKPKHLYTIVVKVNIIAVMLDCEI